jgi:hypothetical protein
VALLAGCSAPEPTAAELFDPSLPFDASQGVRDPAYELPRRVPVDLLLPPNLVKSSLHEVEPEARLDGLFARFRLKTPYGTYEALGVPRLAQLLAETRAIHALRAQPTQGFHMGLTDSLAAPFLFVRTVLTDPEWAMRVWPTAARDGLQEIRPIFRGWRSEREDALLEALLTVSSYKREIAALLNVDVYSANPLLQYELNRVGYEGAVGNWTPSVLTAPLPLNAATAAFTLVTWSQTLDSYLVEANPTQLRLDCDGRLKTMGVSAALRDEVQQNPRMTPLYLGLLGRILERLPHARDRAEAVAWMNDSEHPLAIPYRLFMLRLLTEDAPGDPIVRLLRMERALVAERQSGKRVLPLPSDLLQWTPWLEEQLAAACPEETPLELRIGGRVSERAAKELASRGVLVVRLAFATQAPESEAPPEEE